MQDLIAKAGTLLEALPYIQRFHSQTFVVKYGGSFVDSPDPAVRNGVRCRKIACVGAYSTVS